MPMLKGKINTRMKNDGGRTVMVGDYKLVIVRKTKAQVGGGQTLIGMNVWCDKVLVNHYRAKDGETWGQLRARVAAIWGGE